MRLAFETDFWACQDKIEALEALPTAEMLKNKSEISRLQKEARQLLEAAYSNLSAWDRVLIARHIERPHSSDYIRALAQDFLPLAGDRLFGEDPAILGGFCRFRDRTVLMMGHEKGRETADRLHHNFGMPRPEGYRKAQRLMQLASHFKIPVITFVDTAGAYPGVGAEERGQAEAIARSLEVCLALEVPLISVVIGEGGSGGAVALAAANRVLMLEHAVYSVISPEGCASILWRSAEKRVEAAAALRLTAPDLLELGIIDQVIPEPLGGAHRHAAATIQRVGDALAIALESLENISSETLQRQRAEKFLSLGLDHFST